MPPAEAAGLKIPCSNPQILQAELDALSAVLDHPEREDTWEKMEKAIIRFAGVTRGGGYKHLDLYVRGVGNKGIGLRIVDCMMSDRGRLSGVSTDLLQTMAPRLASHFLPLVHLYLPPLVRLLARPNKVFFKRAEKVLATIIQHCPLPSILIHLSNGLDDRSDQCKRAAGMGIESAMGQWDSHRWSAKDLDLLELCVRKMATDRDAEVRKTARRVWALFSELWPERVEDFTNPLTPTIRRYLDIPADGGPSKPKPRPGLRPRLQAAHAEAESSRHHPSATLTQPVGVSRTRSASRPLPSEERTRVVSGTGAEGSHSGLTRSASHKVLSHTSSSSSLGKSESSRHPVLSKPSRPGQYSKTEELSNSTRRMPPPSRTASTSCDRPQDEPRQTRSTSVSRPAMRPLRQAVSAESMTYASASAAVPISESSSQPLSTFKASVKERVSELEKKAEAGGTPSAYRLSPSKQDLARAAAVPLPEDSPVVPKPSLPLRAQLPDSPSFAMPLNRHPGWNDTLEMPTLLELSLADMTICPSAETPGHAPRRQHSQPLKEATPPPGSVAQLIGRFSSPSETPSKTPRSSTSPSSGESRPQKTSPLSAEVTGSSSSTPAAQRRISPLPRRVSTVMPATYDSPSLSLKRKGSDIELSFAQSTPIPRSKAAPRFSQPLIAFGDMSQNISPFVFGNGAGVFDDLMAIQTGVGEEDEIVHEGFTQLLEGLVVKDAAGFQGDLLGSPAPAALPPALKPEITGGSDLLDFGDDEVEHAAIKSAAHGVKANADESENDETVMEMRPEMVVDVAPIVTVNEEPKTSEAEGEDADETVHAITIASAEAPTPRTPQPVHASPASQPSKQPSTSKLRSEPPLDICALASSMTAATLQSPAHSAHVAQSFTPNQTPPATSAPEPMSVAPSTLPSSSPKITPVNVNLKEVIPVAPSVLNEERSEAEDSLEKKKLLTELEEQPLQQATEEAPIAPLGATTSATDTTSGVAESIPSDPKVGAETSVPAPVASAQPVQPPVMAPTRSRGHVRSTTAPVKSTHTSGRLGPPSRAARGHGDKKPFKPVSRLGTAEGKAAPAPARLAMATKASQAKPAATAAPAHTTSATAPKAPSAPSSKPHSRGPSRPASRAVSRTVSPPPEPQPKLSQSSTSTATAAGTQPKPANKATSNLLKPTAAASARAAATVAAKEKEVKEPPKPFRAPSALASRAPTRTASSSRPAHSLFAPTAASRARAEPALPPSKRQRVKLKAPMESFKPGRRPNAKAAVLGETAPRLRQVRRKEKVEEVKTFPLPGPQLASSTFKAPVKELAADQTATEGSPSLNALNIPGSRDETESMARSPTSLSPLAHSAALSPASSRHTERSYDSSKSSPRKMRPSPSRPLDPILTPLHHALAKEATPTRPGRDTPATAHARRISGIPASVQRSLSASRAAPEVVEEDEGRGGFDGRDLFGEGEKEGATSVVRHDVSTPQGKASSLLAKLSAERRALATRDGNKD